MFANATFDDFTNGTPLLSSSEEMADEMDKAQARAMYFRALVMRKILVK